MKKKFLLACLSAPFMLAGGMLAMWGYMLVTIGVFIKEGLDAAKLYFWDKFENL